MIYIRKDKDMHAVYLLRRLILTAFVVGFSALATTTAASAHDDGTAIRHVLTEMFNRPDSRLIVDPVIVEGEIAVAGWAQGENGGRALLRKRHHAWSIVLCSGDALKDEKSLEQFGLTAIQAKTMAERIIAAEAKLDTELVEKFSRFDGVVRMNDDGSHPPARTQPGHEAHGTTP